MRATGVPGTTADVFCDGFDVATGGIGAWQTPGTASLQLLGANATLADRNNNTAPGSQPTRCFSTAAPARYDVVDLEFDWAQQATSNTKFLRVLMSVGGVSYAQLVEIWMTSTLPPPAGSFRQNGVLLDYFKQLRLTDVDPAAANNANVCVRFQLQDNSGNYTYVDNVCVRGTTYPAGMFSVGALTDLGGGTYTFSVGATRSSTAGVSCTWSRNATTRTTDCSGLSSCPDAVRFVP
jgi:hypothetical protein